MKKLLSLKVLTAFLLVFMVAGLAQAQFTTVISGKVTTGPGNHPGANMDFTIRFDGDTTIVPMPSMMTFHTDENGNYSRTVVMNQTYTLSSVDTFSFQPFSADVAVADAPVEFNIHLDKRTDLVMVDGNISFQGAGVETPVYFLMLPAKTDLNDFRQFEHFFNVPPMMLHWASYDTTSDANGDFTLMMLDGKYAVYVPGTETTLPFWSVFEVKGTTTIDPIVLKEMKKISGNVENADLYDFVQVYAFSTHAGRPAMAQVDANGDYMLDVAPGFYKVRVNAYFYDELLDEDFMFHQFYDSVYTAVDADTVVVGDQDVTGIDFTLPAAEVLPFSVSGQITSNQSGMPIEGAHVTFVNYSMTANMYRAWEADTDAKGMYKVEGYTLLAEDSLVGFAWTDSNFFAQFYDGKATFLTADPIVYHANEDVMDINFALDTLDASNAFGISGTVIDDEGNPVITGNITAFTTATNVGVVTAMIDTNGHYDFGTVFPNGSTVYLQAWGGYGYVPEIYDDAESWADADAIVINGADQVIDFELEKTGPARERLGLLKGYVNLGNSKTSDYDGAVVYVKPVGASQWTDADYVNADGTFSLPIEQEGEYEVMLSTRDAGDQTITVNSQDGEIVMSPTSISEPGTKTVLRSAKLHNAYPNPFNPLTTIEVDMAKTGHASLVIYNVIGQKIKTLFDGNLQQGLRTFQWNGTSSNGSQVASGIYFYQLKTGANIQTKAVMFLK